MNEEEIKNLENEYVELCDTIQHHQNESEEAMKEIADLKKAYEEKRSEIQQKLEANTGQLELRRDEIQEVLKTLYEGKGRKELSKLILNFRRTTKLNILDPNAIAKVGVDTQNTTEMVKTWNIPYLKKISSVLPKGSFEEETKLHLTVKIKYGIVTGKPFLWYFVCPLPLLQ